MIRATVLTAWVDVDGNNHPQLLVDHPYTQTERDNGSASTQDITMQPVENIMPDPNSFVLEIVREEAVMVNINNDSNYFVLTEEEA